MSGPLPSGEHDERWLDRVRPRNWLNPEPASGYHLVVVGAGPAGLVAAAGAAGLGAKVALVERRLMGGDCLNFGCVPSKALVRAARAVVEVREAGAFGVNVFPGATVDFPAVMERVRATRADLASRDSVERFRGLGVDVFFGEPEFVGRQALVVGGATLRFAKAVVATGTRPAKPKIPGLWEAGAHTNESIFGITSRPRRLLVIGAGPVGVELAQAFARLGSRVTLLEAQHGLLPGSDRDAASLVLRALEREDVRFQCCVEIEGVERAAGARRVRFSSKHGHPAAADFDEIVVGAGRVPNVEGLGLEAAGIALEKGALKVDDFLRTTNPLVFGAGDVCLSTRFTHAADASARLALRNALFFGRARWSETVVPSCVYSDPELAQVGALDGDGVDVFRVEMADMDRAQVDFAPPGLLKVRTAKGTDRVVGATLVARHAGDMVGELSSAIAHGLGLRALAKTVRCYPTQSEALGRAADAYNRTRLTPRVKGWLDHWLRWSL